MSPYVPQQHTVQSTKEFITLAQGVTEHGYLASLDVESLFTNVPVSETIDIVIQRAYHHPDLPPPSISENIMRSLLQTCTTETPFRNFNGDVYLQTNGVSMASPLGPLFANFYMGELETTVLPTLTKPPLVYARYVDDIFLLISNVNTLEEIKDKFETASVLRFTYEIETRKSLSFLDVKVQRESDDKLSTSVHIKATSSGECLNFCSLSPERYKLGAIKTFLHRAYDVSSSWTSLHLEIERIKQLLTNNNYPMKVIDDTIRKFLDKKQAPQPENNTVTNDVTFYFKNQMSSQYKTEETMLRKIIQDNVLPTNPESRIQLIIYYRSHKLAQLVIKKNPHKATSPYNIVYQYTCDVVGCQPAKFYIGYTENTLVERMRTHAQNGSIASHHNSTHSRKPTTQELVNNSKVLKSSPKRQELLIAEALFIKSLNPSINAQREGNARILSVF